MSMSSYPIKEYKCDNPKAIIISIHGGCFVGGSIHDSNEQNNKLRDLGCTIYQPDFPKKFSLFKEWCDYYVKQFENNLLPIIIIGRSSGGYLSKFIYNRYKFIKKGIYLCPIMFPKKRYEYLSKFQVMTQEFFDEIEIEFIEYDINEHIFLATEDSHLPINFFVDINVNKYTIEDIKSHYDMLETLDNKLINLINDIIES